MSVPNARVRLKVVTAASAGAANTDVAFRPEAGEIWEVIWLMGYNDDGVAWAYWLWTDDVVTASEMTRKQSAASYDYLNIGNNTMNQGPGLIGPLWVTYTSYPTYRWTASAGAKNGTVKGLIRVYRGMDEP